MPQDMFYQDLRKHADFASLARPDAFTPLPADWVLCCTDIVDSTGLIEAGQYKTVNMVGASVIAAMQNALNGAEFPYVFGGDGASFVVSAADAELAHNTLAGLRSWVLQEFDIRLRAAQFPIARIRAEGVDVAIARYAVSDGADYAMFSGGGLSWAEARMKQGRAEVQIDNEAPAPDLTGLSCRWNNTPARNGLILSVLVTPPERQTINIQGHPSAPETNSTDYGDTIETLLNIVASFDRAGHPVPTNGPSLRFPPRGLWTEAHMTRGRLPLPLKAAQVFVSSAIAWLLFRRNRPTGSFDPMHYLSQLSLNADFRKFDDGLKMTLDCSPAQRDQLMQVLEQAQNAQAIRFGTHEQSEALVTCIVPSAMQDDHVHFVDGAAGGYTRAAQDLRRREQRAAD